jgi:hypothetical protein
MVSNSRYKGVRDIERKKLSFSIPAGIYGISWQNIFKYSVTIYQLVG